MTARPRPPAAPALSVVQVVQSLGQGGLEAMAANLAIALHERGVRSEIVSLEEGGLLTERLQAAGVPHHVLGDGRWRNPRTHAQLTRIFRRAGADVVHTHHLAGLLTATLPARLARVPRVVHTEHAFQYLESSAPFRTTLRVLSHATDRFVVVGDGMVAYYRDAVGVPAGRIAVIRNGIDTDRYRPTADVAAARARLGLADGTLVGTAGRFATVKNFPLLLRAVAAARRERPDLRLAMVGDGTLRAELEALAASLGLGDAVAFLGWRTDLAEILGALDVFALTSFSEGLPLAVLEAMAAGVPAVTSAVGDLPRIVVDDETGYTFPSDDEGALTACLLRLARDADARRAMGARARDLVLERYSQRAMVDDYLRAYAPAATP